MKKRDDEVLKRLSALSYQILKSDENYRESHKKLVQAFNELQDEILKKFKP